MTLDHLVAHLPVAVLVAGGAFVIYKLIYLRNDGYSAEWDKKLNELLDNHKFTHCTRRTARLGEFEVWIANRPYADFTPHNPHLDVSPSQKTLRRARARLVQDQLEAMK